LQNELECETVDTRIIS